ncbi:MAG: exonuclease subunit SbcD [Bacteroidales bacterium]
MAVRILHTSDLHIGKRLYDFDLAEDHKLFFKWLIQCIQARKADYLLMTGDIFDQANPAVESLGLYYSFLADLSKTGCRAIITAGNHDSPALIDAPSDILKALDIRVVGKIPRNREEMIIPVTDSEDHVVAAIAAIPFLRDRDIRIAGEAETYGSRIEAVREGIKNFYDHIAEMLNEKFPFVPHIATGHLFAQDATTSKSEREIQIGNLAGIGESAFPPGLTYVALGHIHKAQDVGNSKRIRYCGAPLPLSFSDADYDHKVILLTIENNQITQEDIEIPKQRNLVTLSGTLDEIEVQLAALKKTLPLSYLVEIDIIEDHFTPESLVRKESLTEKYGPGGDFTTVQSRIKFIHDSSSTIIPENYAADFNEITPEKVFDDLFKSYPEKDKQVLVEIFAEIKQAAEERGSL